MVGNAGGGSQTELRAAALSYTEALRPPDMPVDAETITMETRIRPYLEQKAAEERRAEQQRLFARNQALGLVLLALSVLGWWLVHTNPKWIFPAGWWRL